MMQYTLVWFYLGKEKVYTEIEETDGNKIRYTSIEMQEANEEY